MKTLDETVRTGMAVGSGRDAVDAEAIWALVFPEPFPGRDRGLAAFREVLQAAGGGSDLEFLGGGYRLKIGAGISQTLVTTAVLSGVLAACGFPDLPTVVLPTILPLLFQVERVTLSRKEEEILATLMLRDEVREKRSSARELYDGLAEEIREQLSYLDFVDFLDHLDKAGFVEGGAEEGMTLRDRKHPRLRVAIE
ncbi:MAG: hypothetical protein C4523_12255 [Myxococcales bacterium]|nr:MAG: hypothetical protein C4523_12255 [Myxococcales bacterium]